MLSTVSSVGFELLYLTPLVLDMKGMDPYNLKPTHWTSGAVSDVELDAP
jgi:hypothetical protein